MSSQQEIACSAPGKAFLCGEFVALEGNPALVTAVNLRAIVRYREDGGNRIIIRSSTTKEEVHLEREELLRPDPRGDLVRSVFLAHQRAGYEGKWSGILELDSSALSDKTGAAVGFGSSAAVAVALTQVMIPSATRETVQSLALEAHLLFQGGVGSGYDVVTACRGGIVAIHREQRDALRDQITCLTCEIPDTHQWLFLGGGEVPSTRAVLQKLRSVPQDTLKRCLALMAEVALEAVMQAGGKGWCNLVSCLDRYCLLEQQLGELAGINIVPSTVIQLNNGIRSLEAAAKPSGAGGDGLVVVLTPKVCREEVLAVAEAVGLKALLADIEPAGVRLE
jgi:mevalonate kinase